MQFQLQPPKDGLSVDTPSCAVWMCSRDIEKKAQKICLFRDLVMEKNGVDSWTGPMHRIRANYNCLSHFKQYRCSGKHYMLYLSRIKRIKYGMETEIMLGLVE